VQISVTPINLGSISSYTLNFTFSKLKNLWLWRHECPVYSFLGVCGVYHSIMAEEPHYLGHRERLRQRFLTEQSLFDYELLELLLFQGNPRRDTKPMAKKLLDVFG
jgi:hypothetical protein